MAIEVYISTEEIQHRINSLGVEITKDYAGEELTIISVLTGAFVFTADLIRQIKVPIEIEFITASSYGSSTTSSGEVELNISLKQSLQGKNVLIIEDIVDTGLTIKNLMATLQTHRPKTLKLATLLSKPSNTIHDIKIDYEGFEIEDKFVIGYGLDYAEKYRELPYIGVYSK